MQGVVETPGYLRDAAELSQEERDEIADLVASHPTAGDLMAGTGGLRKIRIAGRGKGKSGGYRIVTYYGGDDIPVFLMGLINKGERENLSMSERNAMKVKLKTLADVYREGVREKTRQAK